MAKRKLTSKTTSTPQAPAAYTIGGVSLNRDDWEQLSNDLWQGVNASLSSREALEQNLKDWTDLYDMKVEDTDHPWPGASNVFIPIIPAQLDALFSYISSKVFVPRFYIVTGNTEDAAATAHDVERYYNAELVRQRGHTTWYDQYLTWLHLALRDGTSVMEVMWRRTETKRKVITFQPQKDASGVPILDMNTGKPKTDRSINDVTTVDYDDVELQPLLLRDFLLIPDEAESIEAAVGVARALFLYEDQLMAMVREGTLDEYWVNFALDYVPNGNNDFASDRQGSLDRNITEELNIGLGQGAQTSKFFRNRGPIKIWRVHSRQYDMNLDGVPEENVFYIHERSQRLLGFDNYKYIVPSRPYFSFSPMPRPNRFYGYSLCERIAPIQAEVNSMYNARNNLIDLMLSPPLLYKDGDELDNNEQMWAPAARWAVTDPMTSVKFMQFDQVPLASFQNESLLNSYVDKMTGQAAPQLGGQSSGKRSATEMRQQAASTTTRNDTIALRLRIVCRTILNFIHALKLQYLPDDPSYSSEGTIYTLPREVLAKDYQLDIAGSSDPLDSMERRRDNMGLGQMLLGVPWIAQDQGKSYNVVRMMLESFNRPDVTQLIGTEQEAQQRGLQQAQAAQKQQEFQQQLQMMQAMHGENPTGAKPSGGKPPSAPHPNAP
jgi:hypothetical protein